MERINTLNSEVENQNSQLKIFNPSDILLSEEQIVLEKFRKLIKSEIEPYLQTYISNAEFPLFIKDKLKEFGVFHLLVGKPLGQGVPSRLAGMLVAEMAKIDSGLSLFMLVSWSVLMTTIEWFGSEEQKNKYLPRLMDIEMVGGWALTEPHYGSDASGIKTTAVFDEKRNGYILNGEKRWIGNGQGDIVVVWAKNSKNNQIQGFIVGLNQLGVSRQVIVHKLAVRMVQNYHLTFKDVFIPEEERLPKAKNFSESTNSILKHSRITAVWIATGICQGVCDRVKSLLPFRQKPKKKLLSMISNTESVALMAWRVSELNDSNKLSIGQVALAKSYATSRGREICVIAKDLLDGIGITQDQYIMKAMMDIEAAHSYEGTYDINSLVAGRELTGISAFKAKGK